MRNERNELIGAAVQANASGKVDEAERLLRRALELDTSSFEAAFWLSLVLRRKGCRPEALEMARQAVSREAKSEHALNQLGMCLLDAGIAEEAAECFKGAIEIAPNVGPFYENLGQALQALGRHSEAISALRHALAIGPVRPGILLRLGDAYMNEPNPQGAAQCAKSVLQIDQHSAAANLLYARALIADGQVSEGAKLAKQAMSLAPQSAVPVAYYGRALQSLGQIAEAEIQFKRSIQLDSRQGFAYHALVHNHKVTESERPLIEAMATLAKDPGLPLRETVQLEYGLGKALEDLGDYEAAMAHFDSANHIDHTLKVGVAPFNRDQLRETADFLIETFTAEFISDRQFEVPRGDMPLFVVGMMRSGTTLAEQILSSHPNIGGVGEQLFWPENAGSSIKIFESAAPGSKPILDAMRLRRLANSYVDLLNKLSPDCVRVVDKMNTNYLLLGILSIAFPAARIIHMNRHPVDTCISIWATPVANEIDLCADKENLVFAYREYLRVMEHWREVISPERLLDVQYEELVSDQERVTRRMVEFCGVPWNDACLKPQDNIRSVKTPSVWQVRQPMYKTSMQRWRKYESCLGAFAQLLDHPG